MRERERFLPPHFGRFNYWKWFRPDGWETSDPLKLHIKRQFKLILTASPAVWDEEVYPWLHKKLSDIPDRQFLALEGYVADDRLWNLDEDAWKILKGLPPRQREAIEQLHKKKWGRRRAKLGLPGLLQTIAQDQACFEAFLDNPPGLDVLHGTAQRIYATYNKLATELLGGGKLIPRESRTSYRDVFDDGSSLLTADGRLPSRSIFPVNWQDLAPKERRAAKK